MIEREKIGNQKNYLFINNLADIDIKYIKRKTS